MVFVFKFWPREPQKNLHDFANNLLSNKDMENVEEYQATGMGIRQWGIEAMRH
jgi:hypothetical protein